MKVSTNLKNWSTRAKNGIAAALFFVAYASSAAVPFMVAPSAHAQAYDTGWKIPTVAQSPAGWTNSAATTVQADDNNYTTNNTGATQGYGSFNFGIPNGAQINGIAVSTNAKSTDSSGCRLSVRLSWDGGVSTTSSQNANLTGAETNYILGDATDTWGRTWTPAELNNPAFLSLLQDNDPGGGCTNDATTSVDTLSVRVYYNLPVQPITNPALAQACGLDIAIVIDNSTSISESEMAQMKNALTSFTNALAGTPTEFSVTRFASSATVLQSFTNNIATVNSAINNVPTGGGYTNWEDGLLKAGSTLPNRSNPNLVIFATDGDPTTSNTVGGTDTSQPNAHLEPAVVAANTIKNGGTRILALGIGLGGDAGSVSRLKQISGPSADTGSVLTSDVITTSFDTLAQALATFATQTCGGTITTQKLIDADGNPQTTNDQTPAAGWTFDINGGSNPAPTVTDNKGLTPAVKVDAGSGYSVNETVQSGYSIIAASCNGAASNGTWNGSAVSGMQIAANNVVRCTFVNALKKGHLTVHKVTNPANDSTVFSVTASGSGAITGQATRNLSTGSDVTYEVTYGTYSVSEALTGGWSQTNTTCENVTVNDNNPNPTCTITNTKLAKLKIVKDAVPNDPQDFAFTTIGTGLSGFSLDDDSDATLASSKEFVELAPGTYTVTEASVGGWSLTGLSCDTNNFSVSGAQVSVALTAGQVTTCTYTNTQLGSLSGTKYEVNADSSPVKVEPSGWLITLFENGVSTGLTQTTDGSGNYTFTGLLPGTYSVTESPLSGWTQIYSPLSPVSLSAGQVVEDQDFGNFKNGSISGYKFNDHDGYGYEDQGDEYLSGWTITLHDANNNVVTQPGLENPTVTNEDGYYSFTNLAPGTYWVCETGQSGWVQTYPEDNACNKVVIDKSGESNEAVKFGNQGRGTITVKKNVDSNGDGTVDYYNVDNWTWDLNGLENYSNVATGGSKTVGAGEYTIHEDQKDNYHFTQVICTGTNAKYSQAESIAITVETGANVVCTYTNTRDTGFVKVVKEIYPESDEGLFDLSVDESVEKEDASDGDDTGWVRVVTGEHTLSEVAGSDTDMAHYDSRYYCWDDWELSNQSTDFDWVAGDGTSVDVPVAKGQYIVCSFYNERHAELTIVKDAQPNDAQDFEFTLTPLYRDDVRAAQSPLAKDTVDFSALETSSEGEMFDGSFWLDDDADETLSNSQAFEVSGGRYKVAETSVEGWDLTGIECSGVFPGQEEEYRDSESEYEWWYVDKETDELYMWVNPGSQVTCTFTNTKRATVTITKDAQPNFAQPFTFTTNLGGDEETSFSLTDDGVNSTLASRTFSGVVPGVYTVSEAVVNGWTLNGATCTGAEITREGSTVTMEVVPGADVKCTFVNQKNTIPQVLGAVDPPKLENTGGSVWVAVSMSLTVMGLAILTALSDRRRNQTMAV